MPRGGSTKGWIRRGRMIWRVFFTFCGIFTMGSFRGISTHGRVLVNLRSWSIFWRRKNGWRGWIVLRSCRRRISRIIFMWISWSSKKNPITTTSAISSSNTVACNPSNKWSPLSTPTMTTASSKWTPSKNAQNPWNSPSSTIPMNKIPSPKWMKRCRNRKPFWRLSQRSSRFWRIQRIWRVISWPRWISRRVNHICCSRSRSGWISRRLPIWAVMISRWSSLGICKV